MGFLAPPMLELLALLGPNRAGSMKHSRIECSFNSTGFFRAKHQVATLLHGAEKSL
jgi:hypothetical protein